MPSIRNCRVSDKSKLLCHLDVVSHLFHNFCIGRVTRGNEGPIIRIEVYFFLPMATEKMTDESFEKGF